MALADGTITNTVEFDVYRVTIVGERSRSIPVVELSLSMPTTIASISSCGRLMLNVVPLIVIFAELMFSLTWLITLFIGIDTPATTWLAFTSDIRSIFPDAFDSTQLEFAPLDT